MGLIWFQHGCVTLRYEPGSNTQWICMGKQQNSSLDFCKGAVGIHKCARGANAVAFCWSGNGVLFQTPQFSWAQLPPRSSFRVRNLCLPSCSRLLPALCLMRLQFRLPRCTLPSWQMKLHSLERVLLVNYFICQASRVNAEGLAPLLS